MQMYLINSNTNSDTQVLVFNLQNSGDENNR